MIGSRLIRRSWSEDRRSRFQPVRLLHLVAHPGDYVAHLHPILVPIAPWTIRKIPEGEKMEERQNLCLPVPEEHPWKGSYSVL